MMGIEWYDMIARRNGGYKSNAIFTIEGLSGEDVFEERLTGMLPNFSSVLDAGCGHGEFTIKMARYASRITGLDGSTELLKIAEALKNANNVTNVKFILATTKQELPFEDGQFDLIYDRRGPTSIINHSRLLRSGGTIFGIHSGALDMVKERLKTMGSLVLRSKYSMRPSSTFPINPNLQNSYHAYREIRTIPSQKTGPDWIVN